MTASSPRVLIHATSLVLADATAPFGGALDAAVLLLGESGSGKSDVALRLIANHCEAPVHGNLASPLIRSRLR